MFRIYTGLVAWNLGLLAVAGTLGLLAVAHGVPAETHQLVGLFTAIFGCLVHSLLVIHFIGSMKWIQQTGPTAGIEDTKALRRAWFRGPMFPVVLLTMLATVAAGMAGGRAEAGPVGLGVHAVLVLALVPMNVWALVLGRRAIRENLVRLRHVEGLAVHRQEAGLVREAPREVLLPESGRAGGKVFLFLAANVWLLWLYARFILRHRDEPVWPYALACALLLGLGLLLLRGAGAPPTDAGPPPGPDGPDGPDRP